MSALEETLILQGTMFSTLEHKAVVHKSLANRQRTPHHTMYRSIQYYIPSRLLQSCYHSLLWQLYKTDAAFMYSRSQICHLYLHHQHYLANGVLYSWGSELGRCLVRVMGWPIFCSDWTFMVLFGPFRHMPEQIVYIYLQIIYYYFENYVF
jgi:hypothetical protein